MLTFIHSRISVSYLTFIHPRISVSYLTFIHPRISVFIFKTISQENVYMFIIQICDGLNQNLLQILRVESKRS